MNKRKLGEGPVYPPAHDIALGVYADISVEKLATGITNMANKGDPEVIGLIDQLIAEGVSGRFFAKIEALTDPVRVNVMPVAEWETQTFSWKPALSTADVVPSREAAYALLFTQVITQKYADRIHKCGECNKYFVGDPRSSWCSKICGSRNRQRAYQERKRARKKRAKK